MVATATATVAVVTNIARNTTASLHTTQNK